MLSPSLGAGDPATDMFEVAAVVGAIVLVVTEKRPKHQGSQFTRGNVVVVPGVVVVVDVGFSILRDNVDGFSKKEKKSKAVKLMALKLSEQYSVKRMGNTFLCLDVQNVAWRSW